MHVPEARIRTALHLLRILIHQSLPNGPNTQNEVFPHHTPGIDDRHFIAFLYAMLLICRFDKSSLVGSPRL